MDQFKSVAAAYNWLVNQIRHKGIFQDQSTRGTGWITGRWMNGSGVSSSFN